jgi:acyl-CoA reductase-like NAD-dependent aldehyde dehydrogenase
MITIDSSSMSSAAGGSEGSSGGHDSVLPPLPTLRIHRPADRRLVGTVPIDAKASVDVAVLRARAAQPEWARRSLEARVEAVVALRREVGRRTDDIADRIVAETGKPDDEALSEVLMVLRLLRFLERNATRILAPRRIGTGFLPGGRARVFHEPVGVVGVLSPWNYPFMLSMEPVATALMAGNAVVLKPSEHTPFTGALLHELLQGAGFPNDLLGIVQGGPRVGEFLVDARPDHLHLVGSPATGRAVLRRAAWHLIPTSVQLGGKDPAIVLADADLERTARGIAFGAFFNAGQTCVAIERVYVDERIYEPFLRKLTQATDALRVGSGGNVDVGPMALESQLLHVEDLVNDARLKGARLHTGGERADPASNIFLPTILSDVPDDARILTEETSGPVLPVIPVATVDEAVALANQNPMGLQASVWTRDLTRGRAVARRLKAGGVTVNDALSHWAVPGLPMGGVGESGWSRTRGAEGLLTFTRTRSVLVRRSKRASEPWWYPYGPQNRRRLRALIGWEQHDGVRGLIAFLVRFFRKDTP